MQWQVAGGVTLEGQHAPIARRSPFTNFVFVRSEVAGRRTKSRERDSPASINTSLTCLCGAGALPAGRRPNEAVWAHAQDVGEPVALCALEGFR